MSSPVADLAARYRQKHAPTLPSSEELHQLYDRYVEERENSILDAAAATAVLDVLVFGDQVDTGAITPQMEEAYRLAFSTVATRTTLVERLAELSNESEDARRGFLSSLKGKYFEVLVKDRFNDGLTTGDLVPGPGQTELAADPTQPGWDMVILNANDSTYELLQLKATTFIKPISDALTESPEFRVLATDEGVDQAVASLIDPDNVLHSGISDVQLESEVAAPLEPCSIATSKIFSRRLPRVYRLSS